MIDDIVVAKTKYPDDPRLYFVSVVESKPYIASYFSIKNGKTIKDFPDLFTKLKEAESNDIVKVEFATSDMFIIVFNTLHPSYEEFSTDWYTHMLLIYSDSFHCYLSENNTD